LQISSENGSDRAIRCEGIGKRYQIGLRPHYRTLRDTISNMARTPFRWLTAPGRAKASDERALWALRDLSFEVRHGEVLGIIGRNGSGKSTLLKVLSRITRPTEGCAEIRGRVGTLLEIGAGFHPELTGRENVFLCGAILGMTRREIALKFDEIVEFSECARMLDTPMKHYSTGMYVRLAFAVAAHLQTEILLVDEVLAVGDAVFQKKCLGKMNSLAHEGRTVLFVSHNMLAVDGLCTRAICLHDGKAVLEGQPAFVTSRYLQNWLPKFKEVVYDDIETAPGNDMIRLHRACARPQTGPAGARITVRSAVVVEIEYWKLAANTCLAFEVQVFNEQGINVFTVRNSGTPPAPMGLVRGSFLVPADLMNNGIYRLLVFVFASGSYVTEWDDLVTFEVHDSADDLRGSNYHQWPGAVRPHLEWATEFIAPLPVVRA